MKELWPGNNEQLEFLVVPHPIRLNRSCSYIVNLILEARCLHAFVLSIIDELALVFCYLGHVLDLIVRKLIRTRTRWLVLLLLEDFINESDTVPLQELAFRILRPVIV